MATTESNNDEESAIGRSRILNILDETIEKIELALCLPIFIKNLDRFANHLSEDELDILSKGEFYESENLNKSEKDSENEYHDGETKGTPSSESLEKLSQLPISGKNLQHSEDEHEMFAKKLTVDINVKKAICIMWNRPDLVDVAKAEYLSNDEKSPRFILIENMRTVRQCSHTRLEEDQSPEAEKRELLHYKEMWFKNDEALAKIKALKPILNDLMSRIQVEQEGKEKLITEMNIRMNNFEINYHEEIEKICADSEKNMAVESKGSEVRQAAIKNDIKILDETFQSTLNGHLKREKELRVKRYKTESQFEVCLDTYDNDMGERQAEYDEILAGYKEEQQEMANLQEKFDEQEKEYIVLMEEKAYEEQLELERHIEDLRRRVAARIIQTYWRALKQRRLERARSKKSKKGKKKGKKKRKKKGKKKGGSNKKKPKGKRK